MTGSIGSYGCRYFENQAWSSENHGWFYYLLCCSWHRTGSGSDRVKHSSKVNNARPTRSMVGETLAEELLDPLRMWLDPVATAPGSVPNTLLSVAQHNNSLQVSAG